MSRAKLKGGNDKPLVNVIDTRKDPDANRRFLIGGIIGGGLVLTNPDGTIPGPKARSATQAEKLIEAAESRRFRRQLRNLGKKVPRD